MASAPWLTSQDLHDAPAQDATIRKALPLADIEAIPDTRRVRFTVSDGSVDRDNDTIDVNGWELGAYKQNPVVLWAHDARSLPVARATSIAVDQGRLVAEAEFATHPFAETVYQLVRDGFLRATSVGFRALDYALNEARQGVDFKRQELLEFSIVPVPANPRALVSASAAGVDLEPLREWVQAVIADWPGELRLKGTVWDKLRDVGDDPLDEFTASGTPLTLVLPHIDKRGRVLSAANEQRLRDAMAALTDVLNSLPQEAPSEPQDDAQQTAAATPLPLLPSSPVPSVDVLATLPAASDVVLCLADDAPDDPLVLHLADPPAADTIDVDLTDLRDALGVVVRDAVRALARDATTRTLNSLRGRVD